MGAAEVPFYRLTRQRSGAGWWLPLVLLLVGAGLRTHGLFANTLHADEALYASWARRIADGSDPLLRGVSVDKPPLLPIMQAGMFVLLGPNAFAARLVNWAAGLLTVGLVAGLGRKLVSRRAGWLAGLLVALSPFAVQFSPSAFTDPLMVMLCTAALLAAVKRQPLAAGVLWGLAFAAKYQAVVWLPLLAWGHYLAAGNRAQARRWLIGCALPLGGLALWLLLRGGVGALAATGDVRLVQGLRPITSWELLPRAAAWLTYLHAFFGVPFAAVVLPAALLVWHTAHVGVRGLLVWVGGVLALYWLMALPLYDRYLLLLLPIVAIVAAAAVEAVPSGVARLVAGAALVGLLLWQMPAARAGRLAVGATPRADGGAAQVAAPLASAPYGTVLYDHWASWQWRYHLYGSGVFVAWQPSPAALVADLAVFYDDRRFIALPLAPEAEPFRRALRDAGYQLELLIQSDFAPGCGALNRPPACRRLALYKINR